MGADHSPPKSPSKPLMSATGVKKVCGELRATTFPHPKPIAEPQPLFYSETTAEYYQKKARQVAVGATTQKRLVPYHMDAPRNRPKEDLSNVVGTRHKLHPCIKHEKYRGSSNLALSDQDPDSKRPWKTTAQVFSECAQVQDTIGLMNSGISSTVAADMHKKQGIYGKTR